MGQMEVMDGLARRMMRVDSALEMILRAGHLAGPDNVIEVCGLIQQEVRQIAEELEGIGEAGTDSRDWPSGKDEAPEQVPAPGEVIQLRQSRG